MPERRITVAKNYVEDGKTIEIVATTS
ncbi:recombinase RecA, partial [Salmonella enterica]|nr:recombinase RecA [Salmonella enterica]ECC7965798.1 recombinase RecA [Salmonella enterica]